MPRLADQREDNLPKTLRDYKSGARRAYEPIMVEVLQPISDTDLVELSYYLAHLRAGVAGVRHQDSGRPR